MHVLYPKRRITQATSDPVTPARGGHAGARKRNGLARSVGLALVAMAIAVAVHGGDPPVRGQSGGSFLPKDTWPRVPNIQPADAWRHRTQDGQRRRYRRVAYRPGRVGRQFAVVHREMYQHRRCRCRCYCFQGRVFEKNTEQHRHKSR